MHEGRENEGCIEQSASRWTGAIFICTLCKETLIYKHPSHDLKQALVITPIVFVMMRLLGGVDASVMEPLALGAQYRPGCVED